LRESFNQASSSEWVSDGGKGGTILFI